ncbi:hypothetical protein DM860_003584 [Cuscuta australis]|uniref:DUF4408 domain-containing protein n=1 Tax=Cuscuta australis TaxID=267555 RepID=A0A328DGA2_9ASTE|nr:hypothetical protein DM860_003584 [Cuscuta australis]
MTITTTTLIFYLKIVFISTGAGGLAMAIKAWVPVLLHHHLPTVAACLRPPYLYAVINAIILTLLYASRSQHPESRRLEDDHIIKRVDNHITGDRPVFSAVNDDSPVTVVKNRGCASMAPTKKTQFADERKTARKPNATMEDTWRMITEKSHAPPQPRKGQLKSRTFNERTSYELPAAAKCRREPWLSQDELNRRVEAFIKKFNEEMRLQRQRSLQRHMEMINHGAH